MTRRGRRAQDDDAGRPPGARRRARRLGATALGTALLGAALMGTGVAPAGAAPPQAEPRLELTLVSVGPAAVTHRTPLTVTGRLRNPGPAPVPGSRVRLQLHTDLLGDRDAVRAWMASGTNAGEGRILPGSAAVGPMGPGQSLPFRVTVPAGTLHLPAAAAGFGPRGLSVDVTTGSRSSSRLRTAIVWFPGKEFSPTRLSLLVPITSTPSTNVAAASPGAAAQLAPGGRLRRIVDGTADRAVAWAVDPAVLSAASRLRAGGAGATATPPASGSATPASSQTSSSSRASSPTSTSPPVRGSRPAGSTTAPAAPVSPAANTPSTSRAGLDAGAWLDAFTAGTGGRQVLGLPFADPDQTALVRHGEGGLLAAADALGDEVTREVLGRSLDTTVTFPAGGAADAVTLRALVRSGRTSGVLAAGTSPPADDVDWTPTGRADVALPNGGRMPAVLFDEQLSSLVSASGSPTPKGGGAATQHLLAELAAITLERPGDPRHVLAVTPRTWSPDAAAVAGTLRALRSAPWVSVRGLDQLQAAEPGARREAPTPRPAARRAELPGAHVQAVAALDDDVTRFAPALVDPDPVVGPFRERSLSLLAAAWRTDREDLAVARQPLARDVAALDAGVHAVRGSTLLLLASKAALPVNVANGLPYRVRVVVTLHPRSGRLVVEESVPVELAPNTRRQQVLVPTRAIASGDVLVEAGLRTPAGDVIGEDRVLQVRVRREWEAWGIIAAAGLLAALLVVGLLRGARRDRPRVPPEAVPDVDDLASARGDRAAARRDAIEEAAPPSIPEQPTESSDLREPTMTSPPPR